MSNAIRAGSIVRKSPDREAAMHTGDIARQVPHKLAGEECLEGLTHVANILSSAGS
jgi:hypothetical protein